MDSLKRLPKHAMEEEGWPKMSEEAIIAMKLDVIILNYNDTVARKGWQDITAVKEKMVIEVNEQWDKPARPAFS